MNNWKEYKVKDFAEVVGGGTPSTKNESYYGGDISWLTPRDLTNYASKYIGSGERSITVEGLRNSSAKIIPKNSILLTSRAPIGYLAIASNELCTNQGFKNIVVNSEIADYNFVYYLIKNDIERIKSLGTGTTFAEVSGSVVKDLKYRIPDLPIQNIIAEILSSLDDKIELNNEINKNLEALAQELFKRWFVDFEFPDKNGQPYKSVGGTIVANEFGELPEGWSIGTLADIANIAIGRTPPRKETKWFTNGTDDLKWISIKDMGNSGVYIYNTSECLTEEAVKKFNIPVITPDTVILSFKLTVGRVSISTERMLSNEAIAHINLKGKDLYPEFVYLLLKNFNFESLGSTSSIATAVNTKSIKSLPIIIPPAEVLHRFKEIVAEIFSNIKNNTLQNKELMRLRDTILPIIISGELPVKDTQA